MERKLILPAEVKVCATCSYWDGERTVDAELGLVVVTESTEGECLVQSKPCNSVLDARSQHDNCVWEHLAPDNPDSYEISATSPHPEADADQPPEP
jgi:hypothetical protein